MIITVASGKGGTGKTTIATNLAATISRINGKNQDQISMIDCDVEEPNAALFLSPQLDTEKNVERLLPQIDQDKCTGCGICTRVCEYNALAVASGRALFFKELCHACGSCTLNCPENAIQETPETIGVLQKGAMGSLQFAQGTLEIGFSSPTPVIRDLKKWIISPDAPTANVYILDASPGASCPVVESFRGADFALLVTEPTPFGLHDLKIVTQMIQKEFNMPIGIVINKSSRDDAIIETFAKEKGIPILMRVPLSRDIAELYSAGKLLVDELPQYQELFRNLYNRITSLIRKNGINA